MSPVIDLETLSEFSGLKINKRQLGLTRFADAYASRSVFLQIGNDDERVGTGVAMEFEQRVVSRKNEAVDFSMYIMPFKGHGVSKDVLALDWIRSRSKKLKAGILGGAP